MSLIVTGDKTIQSAVRENHPQIHPDEGLVAGKTVLKWRHEN